MEAMDYTINNTQPYSDNFFDHHHRRLYDEHLSIQLTGLNLIIYVILPQIKTKNTPFYNLSNNNDS